MAIEIPGLSPLQIELANKIWGMESMEQVLAFFDTLPRSLKIEAYVVYQMILLAWMDEEPVGDCQEAQEVIEYVRNLPC
jgi:hypothetical protein